MRSAIARCVAALVVLGVAPAARGAVFTVTTTADDVDVVPGDGVCAAAGGGCTLRAAVQEANALAGADTIMLAAATYRLTIAGRNEEAGATGDLDIAGSFGNHLAIRGVGSTATVIDAAGIDRVFHVCPSGFDCVASQVILRDLEITGGDPLTDGGGGLRSRAILTLDHVLVDDNVISVACGAGIDNTDTGSLTVLDSTIRGNTSGGSGGGGLCNHFGAIARLTRTAIIENHATGSAAEGGGAFNGQTGELTLTNCTVSDNTAAAGGGGIFNRGGSGFSRTTLNNVTITNNTADLSAISGVGGGGIATVNSFGYIFLRNTIVAGNGDLAGTAPDCGGTLNSEGYNLIESVSGCSFAVPMASDIIGSGAGLGPRQNNGGPSETFALLPGSAAIDGGNPAGCEEWRQGVLVGPLTDDQRGGARPQGAACDIGAFELVTCGDGSVGFGETCDDGNQASGDCCDATCQLEGPGSPCSDGDACTASDACDGAGTCVSGPPADCDDHDPCTRDSCAAASGCVNVPPSDCRAAGKSLLLLKDNADDRGDGLTWKWLKGEATSLDDLASPPTTAGYTLCLYAGSASARVALPAGSRWQPLATKGFKYADPSGLPSGARRGKILAGSAGRAKALVKGKGDALPDDLAGILPLPVLVQLVNDANAVCYESVFDSADVLRNDGQKFKAKH